MREARGTSAVTHLHALEPDALREHARTVVRPKGPATHWTAISECLALVDHHGHWQAWGFNTLRSWAEAEMDLGSREVDVHLALWQMVLKTNRGVEPWLDIGRERAEIVLRAVRNSGDPSEWLTKARLAASADELRDMLRRAMGEDPWQDVHFRVPSSVYVAWEASLLQSLIAIRPEVRALEIEQAREVLWRREVFPLVIEEAARAAIVGFAADGGE